MIAMVRKTTTCCCVAMLALAGSAWAAVSTPSILGSHMVLQAGQPLPVWGKADPGEPVTVSMDGDTVSTTADDDGHWRVELPKRKKGGPLEMTITGKDNVLTYSDILIGEVWIGSGQSNMQWMVKDSNDAEAEVAAAQYPDIRLFYVERNVATEPQEDCKGEWVACTPETVPGFSAVLYFFGRDLHAALGKPVGLIHSSWGGTPAESWTSRETLLANPDLKVIVDRWDDTLAKYPAAREAYDKALVDWQVEAEKAKAEGKDAPKKPGEPQGPNSPWLASGLYNAMIAPLVTYAIKGVVWYQGESNVPRAYQYRTLFPAMIDDWRRAWNAPISFYYVQIANYLKTTSEPGDSAWAELREAQDFALKLDKTGVAVIIDIGEADNIHPHNKQDVGKRLCLNALAKDYGKCREFSGPVLKDMKVKGDSVTLTFNHARHGLVAKGGDAPTGFAIAGEDKQFVWADAKIKRGRVTLSAEGVEHPVAVRYAWADNPVCNLYNKQGLPASPFRTDTWDGVTVGKD